MNWPTHLQALLWGLASGGALLIGAVIGLYLPLPRRIIALVMAFGAGILISVIAFDLMDVAFQRAGILPTAAGFAAGAVVFTLISIELAQAGGRDRKRSRPPASDRNARTIAIGSLLDNIPESIVIGLSLIDGEGIAVATFIAVFLSNIPEALSSSAGMKASGRRTISIIALWATAMLFSGLLSLAGYSIFAGLPPEAIAVMQAAGAGALLAMIADTMIPEAFEETHSAAGLVTGVGFLVGFMLSHGLG